MVDQGRIGHPLRTSRGLSTSSTSCTWAYLQSGNSLRKCRQAVCRKASGKNSYVRTVLIEIRGSWTALLYASPPKKATPTEYSRSKRMHTAPILPARYANVPITSPTSIPLIFPSNISRLISFLPTVREAVYSQRHSQHLGKERISSVSIFWAIHSIAHSSWMNCSEPEHWQMEMRGRTERQQIRQCWLGSQGLCRGSRDGEGSSYYLLIVIFDAKYDQMVGDIESNM